MLRYSQVDFFQVFIYKLSWNKCMIWLFGHNMNCWDIHEWLFSSIDFEFVKFRKTHPHQYAISRVLLFLKFWIWICQIHKDSLTPTCDFPGSKDFQVLILNSSNSERLTHTNMRFPGFYGFWSFEKKILTRDSHHLFSK